MVECLPEVGVIVVDKDVVGALTAPVMRAVCPKNVVVAARPRADALSAKHFLGKSAQKQLVYIGEIYLL